MEEQENQDNKSQQEGLLHAFHKSLFRNPKDVIFAEGVKYDQDKLRYDLISFPALEELCKVYSLGAKKYADRNWEKGIMYSRILAAMLRHITAWVMGETLDKESNLHHLAHAAWCCFTLLHYHKAGLGKTLDNLPVRDKCYEKIKKGQNLTCKEDATCKS